AALAADSARRAAADSAQAAAAAALPDTLPMLTVANAADTVGRALWSVWVGGATSDSAAFPTPTGVDPATLPVLVVAPTVEGTPWVDVYMGAFAQREQAESLRVSLARRGLLGAGSGQVRRTPFALLLADSVRAVDVPARLQALARRDVRAYPLARGGGLVALYAGAYQTQDQALYLARTLQKAGVPATLVYRIGRSL
ncbi:hypothetical protein, partial [Roseisolibacter sp. H3M3-2]|uniref:hypothetical protein n=1 Tax=Roseisolibacter sp. H3M3-2 TaxID=3031323 RepID=UPI0023DA440E